MKYKSSVGGLISTQLSICSCGEHAVKKRLVAAVTFIFGDEAKRKQKSQSEINYRLY
jgi:hypothetical protein